MKKHSTDQPGKIEPDDAALFRAAVGNVNPLPQQNRIAAQPARRKPLLHRAETTADIPDTLSDSGAADAPEEYLGNGLSRLTLRKLRRGVWPVEDSLDLHGCNSDAARKLLQEFLHEAAQRGLKCVRVVHGKGTNSLGGEAVLRKLARHWLTQHRNVLAFCEPPAADGGSGAVLVLLRSGC